MFAFTLFRRHGNPPPDTAAHGVIFFRLDHIVENITRLLSRTAGTTEIFGIEFNNFFIFHVFIEMTSHCAPPSHAYFFLIMHLSVLFLNVSFWVKTFGELEVYLSENRGPGLSKWYLVKGANQINLDNHHTVHHRRKNQALYVVRKF